jgi:outer membrane murein-binding lipoprotein Lpp
MSADEQAPGLENAFDTLTRLAGKMDARVNRADERIDNFDVKMAALADAQTRRERAFLEAWTKTAMATIPNKLSELITKVSELADAQTRMASRLDALIDIISNGRNGKG